MISLLQAGMVLGSSFAMVCARAFQQLNVMHHHIKWVLPTSGIMALMEATIVLNVVYTGYWAVPFMAIGGGLGCLSAMIGHKRLRNEE